MQISVIIPTLNAAESIGQVLGAIPRDSVAEILVVNGGSEDETKTLARAAGARVISEPGRGYGRACAMGGIEACGELAVFMDAGGANEVTAWWV